MLLSSLHTLVRVVLFGAASAAKVTSLPGLATSPCFNHSSGYLSTGTSRDTHLFYWYHEAVVDPKSKPLLLWLNGGPGCSSLGGMFTELGPFVVQKTLNVTFNPYSFNKVANVLFLEQPAGVGFSYPNLPANDTVTAYETYKALLAFFNLYPDLRGRPFYVMGESYGGHYVPETVAAIQAGNAALAPSAPERINIKGFAVGNGYTDWFLDFNANVPNTRYHALTSQSLLDSADVACNGSYARCFWQRPDVECPAACGEAVDRATALARDGSIDIYDIYVDVCLEGQQRLKTQAFMLLEEQQRAKQQRHNAQRAPTAVEEEATVDHSGSALDGRGRRTQTTISPIYPTCADAYSAAYLNLPAVQQAIGVRPGTIPGGKWSDCGNVQYDFNYLSELPRYKQWVAEGELQILIYNGDADYILSHMGNSAWINQGLALNKTREWTKWRGSDGQVAGYFEEYATAGVPLTFLTVKGAGHMVPRDRPKHALDMLTRFLAGGDFDKVPLAPDTPLCPP